MAKSKHRRKPKPHSQKATAGSGKILVALQIVDELIDDGKMSEARQLLESLHRQYPLRSDVLQNLAYVCHRLGDLTHYLTYCEKLAELTPKNAENALALASAYAMNFRPMLALRVYRRFIIEWPEHKESDRVRQDIVKLEDGAQLFMGEANLAGEDGLATLFTHEEIQVMLQDGRYQQGEALARKLIANHPKFAPAYNNLSLMLHLTGRVEEAIAVERGVLSFAPDNFQAIGNLARFLFLNGQREEAFSMADKLKALVLDEPDFWLKQAETFSFLGDDDSVLAAFHQAEKSAKTSVIPSSALIYHLAAVASARLGREADARQYWKKALSLTPGFELALKNLADFNKPAGERHGPWAYDVGYWLPREVIEDLVQQMQTKKKNSAALKQIVENFLQSRPDIRQLIPLMLERCDSSAAEIIFTLLGMSQNSELMETIKDFALGQRGSDQLRFRAAQMAIEAGLISGGEILMWTRGKQATLVLFNCQITDEPSPWDVPRQVKRLAENAMAQLQQGQGAEAERLLNQALELAPGEIRLRNNLAGAYKLQGREAEYQRMIQEIYKDDPNYFFGCAQMAEMLIERGQTEEAALMLKPLSLLKEMHVSEMAMLCTVHIELALKEGRRDTARSWLGMFERVYPDHYNVKILRSRIEGPQISDLMKNIFRR